LFAIALLPPISSELFKVYLVYRYADCFDTANSQARFVVRHALVAVSAIRY
jgi:hypothetical protein